MNTIFKKSILILIIFFSSSLVVQAASVSVVAPKALKIGEQVSATIYVDTGGVPINSFDITLSYPVSLIAFKGYKEESSIKTIWLNSPSEKSGAIHLSGIIPGGVDGLYDPNEAGLQPLPIATLLFKVQKEGQGTLSITHSTVLKNDSKGTELSHNNIDASFSVMPKAQSKEMPDTQSNIDKESPQPFTIEFIPRGLFSRTPSMIIFSAKDTGSGIEKYKLHTPGNSWKDVSSPLPVREGILKKSITIRAIDFDGNYREENIEIPSLLSKAQLLIIVILLLSCYFLFFVVKRKR